MASANYTSYDVRLETLRMKTWPCSVDIFNIARAGLYYLINDSDDMLRCAFCEFAVANWKKDDEPWELHATFVPMCIHILCCKGLEFVKRILERDGCGREALVRAETSMYALCLKPQELTITGISGHLVRKQHSASVSPSSQSGSAAVYRTYRGVQFKLPVNLDMKEERARAESFANMCSLFKMMLDLKVLAEAGFTLQAQNSVQGELNRVMPTYAGEMKRRFQSVDGDDDVPDHGKKTLRITGLPDSCGVERCQPITVGLPRDSGDRDRLVSCFKCHRRGNISTAVGAVTLCSRVWICESCNKNDRQCPVCYSTYSP